MRNIEKLRDYFLGKDPQLKETMADNSLRLIGIEGKNFVLRTELLTRLKKLKDDLTDVDNDLEAQIDAAVEDINEAIERIPFTLLTQDLRIYEDQPLDASWESGWYYTGPYKIYFQDTIEPVAFENTIFYYHKQVGETYITFIPETFFDNYGLFKLFLWWDEDDQQWYSDGLWVTQYIGENCNDNQIPTAASVYEYTKNAVVRHLAPPVAAASDLRQGLYVADDDLRLVTAYEQLQLKAGDFIIAQAGTGEMNLIILEKDRTKIATYSGGHLTSTDYVYGETDIYSETEKVVGKWIDGKPLYEKVLPFTAASSSGVLAVLGDDVTNVMVMNGWYTKTGETFINTLPAYELDNGALVSLTAFGTSNKVNITNMLDTDVTGHLVVRYQKTTD